MASSFFGLYVQRDAIQLAQKSLDITGHNITNINTEGYSRQRLDVCSVANTKGSLGYNTSVTLAGKGADAIGVTQIRDKLLDGKVRKYSSELCDIGAKTTILSDIEDILDDVENEETGLAAILGQWKSTFQSFHATGADRQDLSNICMNSAQSVINVLRNFDIRIRDCEVSAVKDIENTNTRINAILKEMGSLNKQIEDAYVQMNDVNATPGGYMAEIDYGPLELKDQFNSLCDELSQYINITVTEQLTGSYTVEFGDNILVEKDSYAKTDIKFRPDTADVVKVKNADGTETEMRVAYAESTEFYDKDGNLIETAEGENIPEGTKLFTADGKDTGLIADGNGGYTDAEGNAIEKLYVLGENKFYTQPGQNEENLITDMATVVDGQKVYDEDGNEITVNGNFDAECIEYTFSELYVSSHNTAKEWDKTKREVTAAMKEIELGRDDDGRAITMSDMLSKLNGLIESNDVEEAYRYEKEIMEAVEAYGNDLEYNPVFKEHILQQQTAAGVAPEDVKYPAYAITVSEETEKLTGGSIKGLFDMYNGEGPNNGVDVNKYKGIKYYQETIRYFSKALVEEFNSIYADHNAKNPDDPFRMFSFEGAETTANLQIADEWADNPLRCVHPEGTEEGDYNYDELDNEYLNKILKCFQDQHEFSTEPLEYTFEEFVAFYGNTVGGQLEYELGNFDSTTTMYESVSAAREEVMGVSMDEEGVNMMNYQKWYNAISRMITAMDECLEKLINGTGVVGL